MLQTLNYSNKAWFKVVVFLCISIFYAETCFFCRPLLKYIYWCALFGYLYFSFFSIIEWTRIGYFNRPGIALTPFPSSVGWDKIQTHNLSIVNLVCYPLDQAFAFLPPTLRTVKTATTNNEGFLYFFPPEYSSSPSKLPITLRCFFTKTFGSFLSSTFFVHFRGK